MCDCDAILKHEPGWEQHYDNCISKWKKETRPINKDGTLELPNGHLKGLECDFLYHLAMDTGTHDLPKLFGDVKFVCIGGTKHRMREFAEYMYKLLGLTDQNGEGGVKLINLTKNSHRYAMYKVGPVLSVNHGIGIPSMTILVQEVIKLLSYAKAVNPIIFRIGTSGGLKVAPGSVIISSFALNGMLEKCYELPVLGINRKYPSYFDKRLSQEIHSMHLEGDGFETFIGGTMAADDFYRGQARLDGPFCDHSEDEKMDFLKRLRDMGVLNIEMEATAFAALASEAGLRAADVCVTLIDRLNGDQVSTGKSVLLDWQTRPMVIVGRYIMEYLKQKRLQH